jgi:glucuronosyltransferase
MNRGQIGIFKMVDVLFNLSVVLCDLQLQEKEVQKLIHSKNMHFDLIIADAFINECFLGFVHKFKAPLIHICTFSGLDYMGHWVGNPNSYAHIPSPFLEFSDKMSFWERMVNTVMGTSLRLLRNHYYLPRQNAIMLKHFNNSMDLPSLSEIEHTTSILLTNEHFSTSYPKPLMPSVVQVGGIHVKPPKKLPQVYSFSVLNEIVNVNSFLCYISFNMFHHIRISSRISTKRQMV